MRNFIRSLRYAWPFRYRLAGSIVCAIFAAVLWGINISAVYPALQLLSKPDQNWVEQLELAIDKDQKEYDTNATVVKKHRAEMDKLAGNDKAERQ